MKTQIQAEPEKKMKGIGIQKITPFLWFDNQAEEAVDFYVSIFENSKIKTITRYGAEGAQQYGWLQDKYGVSWQIVPIALGKLLSDPDPDKSGRVMQSMLQMKKIDMKTLQQAYDHQ